MFTESENELCEALNPSLQGLVRSFNGMDLVSLSSGIPLSLSLCWWTLDRPGGRIFRGIYIVSIHRDWPELSELEPLFIGISLVQIGPEVYTSGAIS